VIRLKLPRKLKNRIERHQTFLKEGLRADEAMQRSGVAYAAEDVRRPKPVRWRR
jgi:hypothetical protein